MDSITIQPATTNDIPAMVDVQRVSPEASQWNTETYHHLLSPENQKSGGWVAFTGKKLVGLLVFQRPMLDELEILNLAVMPIARCNGIGSKLLRHVLSTHRGSHVFLEVRSCNHNATKFYRHFGFVNTALRKNYYHKPTDDALIMALQT